MLRVLSLGAGVQSSTLFLMSCLGELPKLDHAIFADTGWESRETYQHLNWLCGMGVEHGIPLAIVRSGDLRSDALKAQVEGKAIDGVRFASMPLFVKSEMGRKGMIHRQCTQEYKIQAIDRFTKTEILGLKPKARWPRHCVIEKWKGISVDEASRMNQSCNRWERYIYPLCGWPVDYFDHPFSRSDCLVWIENRFPGRSVPRSSCLGCPFHSDAEWRQIMSNPHYRYDVVQFDRAIRNSGGMRGKVYLHSSLIPIEDVDFRSAEDKGQLNMFENECSGHCGV